MIFLTILNYIWIAIGIIVILTVIAGIFSGSGTWTRMFAVGFDIFCNAITGGTFDITISARAGIAERNGKKWGKGMSYFLSKCEPNHCQLAIQADIDRARAVIEKLSPYDDRLNN
jgi:hypothetical protein